MQINQRGTVVQRKVETCLVVDDDPFDRRMLRRCMEKDKPDMSLLECDTIEGARQILGSVRPDLILLDHRMPDGNGADFARELRQNKDLRDTMICLVTNGDLTAIAPTVPALSKEELTSRTIWDMVLDFVDVCEMTKSDEAVRAVEEFGEAVQKQMAPVLSRLIRSTRAARAKFGAHASEVGHDELDRLEDMLLTLSEMLSEPVKH